jgi:hypothetical protein
LLHATGCNMAKISISEAARLTGKNRTTLHRHIKSGKLSKFLDNDNAPLLDTSELMRVYPTFKAPVAMQQVAGVLQSNSKQQLATGNVTAEIELLKLKLQHAEEKIAIEEGRRHESERREREAKDEVNRLLNIVEKHTYLLAAAPEQESVKKSWWQRVFN